MRWAIAPKVRGGMQMVDVRDVADVHARIMQPGRGPRRYVCGGRLLTFDEMIDALEEGLGRPVRRRAASPGMMRGIGRLSDVAGRYVAIARRAELRGGDAAHRRHADRRQQDAAGARDHLAQPESRDRRVIASGTRR